MLYPRLGARASSSWRCRGGELSCHGSRSPQKTTHVWRTSLGMVAYGPIARRARYIRSVLEILFGGIICFSAACNAMPHNESKGQFERAKEGLIEELKADGVTDARVLEALKAVPREEFVRPVDREAAYENRALPIGKGQTISQPLIVGIMTQLLNLGEKQRVLEIGTGSGYQAAVLSLLCKEVYSIEIDPELAEQARQRLARLGYTNVYVKAGDGFFGWPEAAPFDAIIVTAVAPRVPEPLLAQLKVGGVIVMPLQEGWRETLVRVRKLGNGNITTERFGAVAFVPMRGAVREEKPAD